MKKIENRYVQDDFMLKKKKEQIRINSTFTEVFHEYVHTEVQKKPWEEREQTDNRVGLNRDGKGIRNEEDLSKWTLVLSAALPISYKKTHI